MKVLTVAIKAIKLSDQCIKSKAAFEKQVYMKAYNEVHSLLPPLMESSSSPAQDRFCPKRCLCKSVGWKNDSLKIDEVHTVSEHCVLYEVKRVWNKQQAISRQETTVRSPY